MWRLGPTSRLRGPPSTSNDVNIFEATEYGTGHFLCAVAFLFLMGDTLVFWGFNDVIVLDTFALSCAADCGEHGVRSAGAQCVCLNDWAAPPLSPPPTLLS